MNQLFEPSALEELDLSQFDHYNGKRGGKGPVSSENYLLMGENGKNSPALKLCVNKETANSIERMFGVKVHIQYKASQIVVVAGDDLKLYRPKGSERGNISITKLTSDFERTFGTFKRLYLDVRYFSNAVMFIPNGKRE